MTSLAVCVSRCCGRTVWVFFSIAFSVDGRLKKYAIAPVAASAPAIPIDRQNILPIIASSPVSCVAVSCVARPDSGFRVEFFLAISNFKNLGEEGDKGDKGAANEHQRDSESVIASLAACAGNSGAPLRCNG